MGRPRTKPRKHLPALSETSSVSLDDRITGVLIHRKDVLSLESTMRYLSPRERTTTLEWCRSHARNVDGRPYSYSLFPHLGSPGGPSDTMDDPNIRRIWLQFASRLGKTYFGQCCAMKKADCNPGPMMLASSVEKTAVEVTERTYRIIEHSPKVAWQLRPKIRRRQSCIDFDACQCVVAWSRSVSTLADKEVEFGHANEIDKWEHQSTSREADPLQLFLDRFKNRPHHKILMESTPSIRGNSRVESGRLGSTNCEFFVPCPHCSQYQTLKMGTKERPQLYWQKLPNGRSDKDLARKTAYYICEFCEEKIEDYHRSMMMRYGVWVPEGCKVNSVEAYKAADTVYQSTLPPDARTKKSVKHEWKGWKEASWVAGTPLRDGPDAGYRLSSLYALSLGWGEIASAFVSCTGKPQELRNFINQWLAETWENLKRTESWEQLGQRIIDKEQPRGVAPDWTAILTVGIDRQASDGQAYLPWVVDAWGPMGRCATIDYGNAESFDDMLGVVTKSWPKAGGGSSLRIDFGVIDSGYKPDGIYEFCRQCHAQRIPVWPGKGSNHVLESEYRLSQLGPNTSMPNMTLIYIDTVRSQLWLDSQLDGTQGKYTIFNDSVYGHQDFLEQLVNDASLDVLDPSNNVKQVWQRIDARVPNDMRDCRRQSYIARLIKCGGRDIAVEQVVDLKATSPPRRNAVVNSGITREDGSPWL